MRLKLLLLLVTPNLSEPLLVSSSTRRGSSLSCYCAILLLRGANVVSEIFIRLSERSTLGIEEDGLLLKNEANDLLVCLPLASKRVCTSD